MDSKGCKAPLWFHIVRLLPLIVVSAIITAVLLRRGVDGIAVLIARFSHRLWITTAVFMGLYCLKSISFGLPFVLLYVTVGSIYPFGWAVLVNVCGLFINMQIPYLVGRYAGTAFVERLTNRFPGLVRLQQFSQRSGFLFTLMVKFISKIPSEITNMFLGSLHIPYLQYIAGGILGLVPSMITVTLMGNSVDDPGSPLFIVSALLFVGVTTVSLILYHRHMHSNSQ